MPFDVSCLIEDIEPHYNAAPSQSLPVLIQRPQHAAALSLMHWGLIPSWAKDKKISYKLINARSETAHEKPSFKHAFRKQRALIPVDGWYEWLRPEKQPYYHKTASGEILWIAGLWESWMDPATGEEIPSFTLLTQEAYGQARSIHDRMPVLMSLTSAQQWLDPQLQDVTAVRELMTSQPACELAVYPVSTAVNKPQFNNIKCLQALT